MLWIRSALYAVFLVVTVIPYALACLLWAPLPMRWRYRLTVGWPILAVWGARAICGIRWKVEGIENLPDAPAVVLSKHQSAWETCFLPYCLPRQVCFVYKKELHWVPFFGWGLGLLGEGLRSKYESERDSQWHAGLDNRGTGLCESLG